MVGEVFVGGVWVWEGSKLEGMEWWFRVGPADCRSRQD